MSLLRASGLCCRVRVQGLRSTRLPTGLRICPSIRNFNNDAASQEGDQDGNSVSAKEKPTKGKFLLPRYMQALGNPGLFQVSQAVRTAMEERKPIVALETAIYTHGFPKPDNYHLALEMEQTVRDNGAVPATIGIMNGRIVLGMTASQLEEISLAAGTDAVRKISRRDLAYAFGATNAQPYGGTTIAGTVLIARLAGLRVVATGGLGGVHRGGENSMDVSADLQELSKANVAVVTSGMKSFLDVPRTMEYLETQGVLVATFGDKSERVDIPGFFSRESGYPSPYIVETPEEAARIQFFNLKLSTGSGALFFNPIPKEYEIPKSEMDPIIASAVEKSSSITGKDNTPAVLNEILKQTEGRSIAANRELVLNNAKIGAKLAVELHRLENKFRLTNRNKEINARPWLSTNSKEQSKPEERVEGSLPNMFKRADEIDLQEWGSRFIPKDQRDDFSAEVEEAERIDELSTLTPAFSGLETEEFEAQDLESTTAKFEDYEILQTGIDASDFLQNSHTSEEPLSTGGIVVVGGIAVDVIGESENNIQKGVSTPGTITSSVGGVAWNLAVTIKQLSWDTFQSVPVNFVSAVGNDWQGNAVFQALKKQEFDVKDIELNEKKATACYMALNNNKTEGGLEVAMADMGIITSIEHRFIEAAIEKYRPKIVCFDGNLHPDTMVKLTQAAKSHGALVVCEPTSSAKSYRVAKAFQSLATYPGHNVDIISPNAVELKKLWQTGTMTYTTEVARSLNSKKPVPPSPFIYRKLLTGNNKVSLLRLVAAIDDIGKRFIANKEQTKAPDSPGFKLTIERSVDLLPIFPNIITKFGDAGVLVVRLVKNPNPVDVNIRYTLYQSIEDDRYTAGRGRRGGKTSLEAFWPVERYDPTTQVVGIHVLWVPANELPLGRKIVSSNGAGDTFLGTLVHGIAQEGSCPDSDISANPWRYLQGKELRGLLEEAQDKAVQTVLGHRSHYVSPRFLSMSPETEEDIREYANSFTKRARGSYIQETKNLDLEERNEWIRLTRRARRLKPDSDSDGDE